MSDTLFHLVRAGDASLAAMTATLNAGFSDYLLPIHFDESTLARSIAANEIRLADSFIARSSGTAVMPPSDLGIALVAYRDRPRHGPWRASLFAMCVVPAARRLGVGGALLQRVLDDARARGCDPVTLEVLEPNDRALRLYERLGFRPVRRLFALSAARAALTIGAPSTVALSHSTPGRCAAICARWADVAAPWQLSPETLRGLPSDGRGCYRIVLEGATVGCLVVVRPGAPVMGLTHLVVSPTLRRRGIARAALQQLVRQFPATERIEVPALFPEDCFSLLGFLLASGFALQPPHQFEMACSLLLAEDLARHG